ncbi:hypothetical protein JQN58_20975 [Aneurinibacillus sp. BA2021]|nr:hypothetical protein [Aneurinibacillus sp. BA2021]
MEDKYICKCGMYTYHCECLPAVHTLYYDDLLDRLTHGRETIVNEEELTTLLRLIPKQKEARLLLHPVQHGYYSMQVIHETLLPHR